MSDAADALHPALVHHIVNSLGWPRLRPLQEAAVAPLLAGDHALLVAPTAGGKTEAAFFPVLSRMLTEDWSGLTVLYLCPLRALLNNLHVRLDGYAQLVGRRVGLWHGDVGDGARQRWLRDAPDILLTTPESLEAMLLSTRVEHLPWFANLRTVVIDEAHAFGADDRGWHMLAVLERVSRLAGRELQRVALSATVGNPDELLGWLTTTCTGPRSLVQPPVGNPVIPDITLDHVHSLDGAATVISRLHRGEKRLVFVDSRARAEQLTAALRAREVNTFVSHGSLGREERLRSEDAFTNERDAVIVATSALELGIDVGDLDRMIQLDAPGTVASFLQRLGRTGRRAGSSRNALFLTTSDDALVRAAALLQAWSTGWVEPISAPVLPLHLVAQQLVALVLQEGHVGRNTWKAWLGDPFVFGAEAEAMTDALVAHLVGSGYLIDDAGMLSIGPRAEGELGRRHFLELVSVFTSPPLFTVLHGRTEVGMVPDQVLLLSPQGGARVVLLAGRTWKANHLDWKRRIAHVEPVDAAGVARWQGSAAGTTQTLARAARAVLSGADPAGVTLSRRATAQLAAVRADFSWVADDATSVVRDQAGRVRWWTFAGDLPNQWIAGALEGLRQTTTAVTSMSIAFDDGVTLDEVGTAVRGITEESLSLSGAVAADAVDALKFSELLPPGDAQRVVLARLDRRAESLTVLHEPVSSISLA